MKNCPSLVKVLHAHGCNDPAALLSDELMWCLPVTLVSLWIFRNVLCHVHLHLVPCGATKCINKCKIKYLWGPHIRIGEHNWLFAACYKNGNFLSPPWLTALIDQWPCQHFVIRNEIPFTFWSEMCSLHFVFLTFCLLLQRTYSLVVEAWDWDNGTRHNSKFLFSFFLFPQNAIQSPFSVTSCSLKLS